MKKNMRMLSLVILLATLMVLLVPTAANAATKTVTVNVSQRWGAKITVKTGSATTLKFTQTKGTLYYTYLTGARKHFSTYGCYRITVKDNTANSTATYYVNCTGSKSISLKANRSYTITVVANTRSYVYTHVHNTAWWTVHQASWARTASDLSWDPMTNWKVTINNLNSGSYSLYAAPNQ